jgi:hypothetical protein
MRAHETSSGIG